MEATASAIAVPTTQEEWGTCITSFDPLVKFFVHRLGVADRDREDLQQIGRLAVWKAVRSYSPKHHVSLSSYVSLVIKREFTNFFRAGGGNLVRMPRKIYQKYRTERESKAHRLVVLLDTREVSENNPSLFSQFLEDLLMDNSSSQDYARIDSDDFVGWLLGCLPSRHRTVLAACVLEEIPLTQVGMAMNRARPTISHVLATAICFARVVYYAAAQSYDRKLSGVEKQYVRAARRDGGFSVERLARILHCSKRTVFDLLCVTDRSHLNGDSEDAMSVIGPQKENHRQ